MRIRLKPLDEQVIVITGATSRIGLVTGRTAARRGARLMLVYCTPRLIRSATSMRVARRAAWPGSGARRRERTTP